MYIRHTRHGKGKKDNKRILLREVTAMQKKEIEKIPPLKTEKAAAQYKAIAVSKAIKIKKPTIL